MDLDRIRLEKDLSKLCGELCRNNPTKLKDLTASPDFQLAVEVARLVELMAKNRRKA